MAPWCLYFFPVPTTLSIFAMGLNKVDDSHIDGGDGVLGETIFKSYSDAELMHDGVVAVGRSCSSQGKAERSTMLGSEMLFSSNGPDKRA